MDIDGAIVEQVFYGFCTDVENDTNKSAALKLLKQLKHRYAGVTYVKLDLQSWTEDFPQLRPCM